MSNQEKKLTPKQKDILAAATKLFAEKGYAATSTSEIAKKAGVAEGTIFRHYKTKKDLLLALVSPAMVTLIAPILKEDLDSVLEQDFEHFEDFIRAMIQNRTIFLKNNFPLLRIIFQELPFHAELKEQLITHIGLDVFGKITSIIEHYQEKGQMTQDLPPSSIIRTFASSVLGYIIVRHFILPGADWDDDAEVDRLIYLLKHGVAPK